MLFVKMNPKWWPRNPGSVLVIPNDHHENVYGLPIELGTPIRRVVRRRAELLRRAWPKPRDRRTSRRSAMMEFVERPTMRMSGPTLDSSDPIALAEFYERLLGWSIVRREGPRPGMPSSDGWARLRSPDGAIKIEVQWEPHHRPPTWPGRHGEPTMMMHLDIGVADLESGVRWAVEQGARLADDQPQDDVRVMIDPDRHPFCLFPDDSL